MHAVYVWLLAIGWYGVPHWGWLATGALLGAEYLLPRIKNPRARSLVELVINAQGWLLGRFPVIGPLFQRAALLLGTPQSSAGTAKPPEPNPAKLAVLLPLLLIPALFASACASGADGARQAEANANAVLGGGYRATVAFVKAADADALSKALSGKDSEGQAELDRAIRAKTALFRVLDTASEGIDAQDAAILGYEAAKKKDYSGIISALIKIGSDIVQACADNGVALHLPGVK